MSSPSPEQLLNAVESVIASTGGLPPDAHGDVELSKVVLAAVKDEHFLWKLSAEQVLRSITALREAAPRKYKEPKKRCKFDFSKSKTGPLLFTKLVNEKFDGIHHAQGGLGSSGVYLLKIAGGKKAVVLKLVQGMPSLELAGNCLALYLGLAAPAMRPLPSDELNMLVDKLWKVPVTVPGTCRELFESRDGQRGILMEFTPGWELNNPKAIEIIQSASPAARAAFMEHIGHVIAVDMVLNNSDRVPYIWRGEGNPGNILVSLAKDETIDLRAIDQALCPIADHKILDKYVEKIGESIGEAMQRNAEGKYITQVAAFLAQCWGVKPDMITVEDRQCIQAGIILSCMHIVADMSSVANQVITNSMTLLTAADVSAKPMLAGARISLEADFEEYVRPVVKAMSAALKAKP